MALYTHNSVAPAKAGAYLALRIRRIDVIDTSLRWCDEYGDKVRLCE